VPTDHRQEVANMGQLRANVEFERERQERDCKRSRELLFLLLRARFGTLPLSIAQAVRATQNEAQFVAWFRRAITANRLDELRIGSDD
jgi:hypothetical protein